MEPMRDSSVNGRIWTFRMWWLTEVEHPLRIISTYGGVWELLATNNVACSRAFRPKSCKQICELQQSTRILLTENFYCKPIKSQFLKIPKTLKSIMRRKICSRVAVRFMIPIVIKLPFTSHAWTSKQSWVKPIFLVVALGTSHLHFIGPINL